MIKFPLALAGAVALGVAATLLWQNHFDSAGDSAPDSDGAEQDKGEPLYWVAPMDDSYRRDEPGQSPMGMDLVPVYPGEEDREPGDVKINPTLAHNLGLTLGRAEMRELDRPINTLGRVETNQHRLRHFHVRASGWVSELTVATEGDPVRAGQKLFEFYSPEIVNLQREYLQGLRGNESSRAESSLSQMRAKGVSEREIRRLREEKTVREKLHYYADRDGYVVSLGVREGNFVDLAQNLMSIGSLEDIWVTVELFERDADFLSEGQKVQLSAEAFPGRQWEGKVDHLYPELAADTRTLRARLVFPNEDGALKPGMFISARLSAPEAEPVLSIPRSALIRTGDGQRVVRQIEPEVYRSVRVETGRRGEDRVEILAGLREGDKVVRNGLFLIDSESSREADLSRLEQRDGDGEMDHSETDDSEMDHSQHGGEQ